MNGMPTITKNSLNSGMSHAILKSLTKAGSHSSIGVKIKISIITTINFNIKTPYSPLRTVRETFTSHGSPVKPILYLVTFLYEVSYGSCPPNPHIELVFFGFWLS